MKNAIILIVLIMSISCNWIGDKAKNTANKTGEAVATVGSEFGQGVYEGVKESFQNDIQLSNNLKENGLELGVVNIKGTDPASKNILSLYMIFKKDFNQTVVVKLFNETGKEYGRRIKEISGKQGQAKYIDIIFDQRVKIGIKGKLFSNSRRTAGGMQITFPITGCVFGSVT